MGEELPSDHDVVVVGTGMTESILSAAFSRAGMRVLHLDMYDNYGGKWGAYNFKAFQQLLNDKSESPLKFESPKALNVEANERVIHLPFTHNIINNITHLTPVHKCTHPTRQKEVSEFDVKTTKKPIIDSNNESSAEELLKENGLASGMRNTAPDEQVIPEATNVEDTNHPSSDVSKDDVVGGGDDNDKGVIDGDEYDKEAVGGADDHRESTSAETSMEASAEVEDKAYEHSVEDIEVQWRRFNLDLLPKVLFSKGPLVELLISSDVARYCEFKLLNRLLTPLNGRLVPVPSSRSEVFATDCVSLLDKRQLMKFLTSVAQQPQLLSEEHESSTFKAYLSSLNLSSTLQHFIQYAIAMVDDQASAAEGVQATHRYLDSLGRYDGNSSFLVPLYGTGELLQCFCRLSAVFGGIYCLRRTVASIILDQNHNIKAIIDSTGQRLTTKWLVIDSSYASNSLFSTPPVENHISRAILITNKSVDPSKPDSLTLCNIPGADKSILMHEFSSVSMTCPSHYYVVHLTCKGVKRPHDDFESFLQQHFNLLQDTTSHDTTSRDTTSHDTSKPTVVWGCFFSMQSLSCDSSSANQVLLVNGPDTKLDCDSSVAEAERLFKKVCPDLPFLPRAPKPEEIVYGDDDVAKGSDDGAAKGGDDGVAKGGDDGMAKVDTKDMSNNDNDRTVAGDDAAANDEVTKVE